MGDRQRYCKRRVWAWGTIWMACSCGVVVRGDALPSNRDELKPTAAEVIASIKKGSGYLLDILKEPPKKGLDAIAAPGAKGGAEHESKVRNNFETFGLPWAGDHEGANNGGETAVVMYALLHTGKSINDPRLTPTSPTLAPVMEYLSKLHPDGTYVAGLGALAQSFAPQSDVNRRRMGPYTEYLLQDINRDPGQPKNNGGFGYRKALSGPARIALMSALARQCAAVDPNSDVAKSVNSHISDLKKWGAGFDWGGPDGSNSQYGVLGLWAADGFGLEIPRQTWLIMDGYWRRSQTADGDFLYSINSPTDRRKAITVAGLASLYITSEQLDTELRLEPREDRNIALGVAKVAADFDSGGTDLYYTYGLARVGLASGKKFFGTRNWYRETAKNIVSHQRPDGSFDGNFVWGTQWDAMRTLTTSYALLFLSRGQNAVPFNKLEYNGPWNARRTDDANLVDWLGKQYEKEFNWQSVNLQVPPEEWLDAPVLLITGSKALKFSDAEQAKIKRYIDMGGLVFSSNDGGGAEFDESVRALMKKMFPQYPARQLTKDDLLFSGELGGAPITSPPSVAAVSNGVRNLWLHTPEDMGASWFKRAFAKSSHFLFPRNVYFYAVSLNLARTRLDDIVVRPGNEAMRSKATVARVKLGGGAGLEPFAWERMSLIAKADMLMDLNVTSSGLPQIAGDKPALAVLTGNQTFAASGAETTALQDYLNNGGTLFADAAGGSKAFSTAFLSLMHTALPGTAMETIPTDDELYSGKNSGAPLIGDVQYRRYSRHVHGSSLGKIPRLRGIKIGNRWAVIFSEYDVTSGLLGTETWGIDGYASDSAVAIARNVIRYAQQPHPAK